MFAPDNRTEARRGAAAVAGRVKNRRAIARAIANQRHRLDAEGGGHDFADFAVSHRLAVVVENFQMQLFVVQMPAHARGALAQRIGQLGDAVS